MSEVQPFLLQNPPSLFFSTITITLRSFRTTLFQLRLIHSSLCPSYGVEPHTTGHIFSCSLDLTLVTDMDLWKRPHLASEFLFGLPLFDLQLPPTPEPPPSGGQSSSSSKSYYSIRLSKQFCFKLAADDSDVILITDSSLLSNPASGVGEEAPATPESVPLSCL